MWYLGEGSTGVGALLIVRSETQIVLQELLLRKPLLRKPLLRKPLLPILGKRPGTSQGCLFADSCVVERAMLCVLEARFGGMRDHASPNRGRDSPDHGPSPSRASPSRAREWRPYRIVLLNRCRELSVFARLLGHSVEVGGGGG